MSSRKSSKAKKVWDKLFLPGCYGDPKGKLNECCHEFLSRFDPTRDKNWRPCKHYDQCLDLALKRQKLIWKKSYEEISQ